MPAYMTSFFSLGKWGKDTLPLTCFLHWKKNAFLPKGKTPRKKQHQTAVISTTDSDRVWVVVAQSVAVTKGGCWGFRAMLTWLDSENRGSFPDSCWDLPNSLDAMGIARSVGFWGYSLWAFFFVQVTVSHNFPIFQTGVKFLNFS